ncbi:hypothetical protein EJB05_22833 [Eragrostis curvula]|uniref:SHSP domain-containing protein n=1 Tax=Eragrostis curvula TaxID=38414 RepID=A0A5J9V6Z1_9POAL|nr:hypothetical protein EJB05_22833 [Eragrostis curvula]
MSTLMASYTTAMSRLPVLPVSSVVQARGSWRPSVASKPPYAIKCRRPLTVTCALPEKEQRPTAFSIPPTALLCPVSPPDGKERWDIKEEDERITLWLQVPGVSANDIEVTTSEDVLVIKRKVASSTGGGKEAAADVHGVGAFHIRLLMTKEYDGNNVTANLKEGMLEVTVPKDLNRKGTLVKLGGPPRGKDDASSSKASDAKPGQNNNKTN